MEHSIQPQEIRLHRGHMTNGIPSWAIPRNVRWNGECRLWYYFVPYWGDIQDHYDITQSYRDHIPDYPCHIDDIIETQEYLKILEVAGIDVVELHGDLQRRMRVLRWLHHCNVETAKKWEEYYSKFPMDDILSHPLWQDMGMLLKGKEERWVRKGGPEMEEALISCDYDFEKVQRKMRRLLTRGAGRKMIFEQWSIFYREAESHCDSRNAEREGIQLQC